MSFSENTADIRRCNVSDKADTMKNVTDACAAGLSAACVMEWVAPIAAVLSLVWLVIRIGDYFIFKRWKDNS
jgi:hypothetical protein